MTDRVQQSSSEHFRRTLDATPVVAFTVDRERKLTYFNNTTATLLQAHNMPAITLGDSLNSPHITPCSELTAAINTAIAEKQPVSTEIMLVLPLHKLKIDAVVTPFEDDSGVITEISVFGQEVRGADPAIARVSTAANSWQLLFSNMAFYVWTYYFETDTLVLTPNSYKDLDLGDDFAHRLPFTDFLAIVHPEQQEQVRASYRRYFAGTNTPSLTQEYRLRHRNGDYVWVRDKVSIQYEGDKALYAVGLFEDISDTLNAEEATRAGADQLRLALDAIGGAVWTSDLSAGTLHLDAHHAQQLGLDDSTLSFEQWFSLIHPDDLSEVIKGAAMTVDEPELRLAYRLLGTDDKYFQAVSMGRGTAFNSDGVATNAIGVMYDASSEYETLEKLRLSEERLKLAFEAAKEGVWELTPKDGKTFRSQSYLNFLGYTKSDDKNIAPNFGEIILPEDREHASSDLLTLIEGPLDVSSIDVRMRHRDGHTIHTEIRSRVAERDASGTAVRIVGVVEDISERVAYQREIEELAYYDPLTQLPNRRLLMVRANQALQRETRASNPVTVMMLDMNKFKEVNDTLGHDAGDAVLVELSRRFAGCVRDMDSLGRQGGDEFMVVLPACDKGQALAVARRIVEQVRKPVQVKGHAVSCGVSIGIASAPDNGNSIDELLRNADIAMYRAKDSQDSIAWFDPVYAREMELRIQMVRDLEIAIAQKGLSLHYQPRISLENGEIVSVEALLRWQHPELGFVPPDKFIRLAEDVGLICKIGKYVIDQACRELANWKKQGIDTTISINASPDELIDEHYAESLLATIQRYQLSNHCIEIELTETAAISNWDKVINTLNKLDSADIVISLDDWGTGYSSLSYLTQLPAHYVKLDRSFIENLHNADPRKNTQLILKGMTGLTKSLGFELVAEGIETEQQALSVKELGCRQGQGYLFSPPVVAADALQLLQKKYIALPY